MSERGAAFEQHLSRLRAHRDDPAAWSVFSDFVAAEGFPRGELMALHARLEAAPGDRSALETRRLALFKDHLEAFLGPKGVIGDLQLTWRRGFIASAVVPNLGGVRVEASRELARHPSGALLDALEVVPAHAQAYFEADGPRPVRELTLRAGLQQLTGLALFGDAPTELTDLDFVPLGWLARRAPELHTLRLLAPLRTDARALAHPGVRELELNGEVTGLEGVLERCPAVTRLLLGHGRFGATYMPEPHLEALVVSGPRRLESLTFAALPREPSALPLGLVVDTLDLRQLELESRDVEHLIRLVRRFAGKAGRVQLPRLRLKEALRRRLDLAVKDAVTSAK
ncbi:MAG: hypothetical protein U0228_17120 [Myxococcaceae bacterium]